MVGIMWCGKSVGGEELGGVVLSGLCWLGEEAKQVCRVHGRLKRNFQ